jgi:cellulase/cellobiase CelA1
MYLIIMRVALASILLLGLLQVEAHYFDQSPSPVMRLSNSMEEKICNAGKGSSYDAVMKSFPELADAIKMVQDQGVVSWYTDNSPKEYTMQLIDQLVSKCSPNDRIPIVVYGIPGKDCEAGYSNRGFNKNMEDYKEFIKILSDKVGTRKVVYIMEPDAIGLSSNNGCGVNAHYPEYVQMAVNELSKNPNADIFMDVGYWTIEYNADKIAATMREIWPKEGNGLKGIVLNTSNYQKTEKMIELCKKFGKEFGRPAQCVIDTSRNYLGAPSSNEWCNTKNTGIGHPPTSQTGHETIPYYLWVKPPGESDGECTDRQSGDSMKGPAAGSFFKDHFVQLWNNGFYVKEGGASLLK